MQIIEETNFLKLSLRIGSSLKLAFHCFYELYNDKMNNIKFDMYMYFMCNIKFIWPSSRINIASLDIILSSLFDIRCEDDLWVECSGEAGTTASTLLWTGPVTCINQITEVATHRLQFVFIGFIRVYCSLSSNCDLFHSRK